MWGHHFQSPFRKSVIVGGVVCVVSRVAMDQQTITAVTRPEMAARIMSHYTNERQRCARTAAVRTRAMIALSSDADITVGKADAARFIRWLRLLSLMVDHL
jgi:hypothetical protein